MRIESKINEMKHKRREAQSWFEEEEKRIVSTKYDNRETADIRKINVEVSIAYYEKEFKRKPTSILDVGCGQGQIVDYFISKLPNAKVTGIDSSEESIDKAKELALTAEFICGQIENLNLIDRNYDVIFFHLCFGLLKNPLEVLSSLIPFMSDESVIYIVDLNRSSLNEGLSSAVTKNEEEYLYDQYNASFTVFEFEELLDLITENNDNLSYKIGTGIIGGFNPNSSDFLSLISNVEIQNTLKLMHQKNNYSNTNKSMPEMLSTWIIKKVN